MKRIHTPAPDKTHLQSRQNFKAAAVLTASLTAACGYASHPLENPIRQEPSAAPVQAPSANHSCGPAGPGFTQTGTGLSVSKKGILYAKVQGKDCTSEGTRQTILHTVTLSFLKELHGNKVKLIIGYISEFVITNGGAREPPKVTLDELAGIVRDKKIVLVGDIHTDTEDDYKLIKILPSFRKAGFDTLGLEYATSLQPLADSFLQAHGSDTALSEFVSGFEKRSAGVPPSVLLDPIIAASENGMKIRFIEENSIAEAVEIGKFDTSAVFSKQRTNTMFQDISEVVDNGGRLVFNTGIFHAINAKRVTIKGKNPDGSDDFEAGPSLGYLLKQKYGDSQVFATTLSACVSSFLDACPNDVTNIAALEKGYFGPSE